MLAKFFFKYLFLNKTKTDFCFKIKVWFKKMSKTILSKLSYAGYGFDGKLNSIENVIKVKA